MEKAVQDPKVIEMVTDKAVSTEKLTRPISMFVPSQVSKAEKDFTVENSKSVGHRPSSPSCGPPCYASSVNHSIDDFSPKRRRSRHERPENRRKVTDRSASEREDHMIHRDRKAMTKSSTSSDETGSTSRSGGVPGLSIILSANELFRTALDCRTYCHINKLPEYDASVARRISMLWIFVWKS